MRVVGGVRPSPATRSDCDKPLRAVCRQCEHVEFWRCETYGCAHCGELKRRRLSRLVEDGSGAQLGNGLRGYFVTLNGPGENDHLRWYQGQRPQQRDVCECHKLDGSLGGWNAGESKCWNRFRTALARDQVVIFVGAVETQKRGVLHRHVVIFTDEVLDWQRVQRLALAAGYGCVMDVQELRSVGQAARYVSKYVTKASGDRATIPWEVVDLETGEVITKKATYRLWSCSQTWGVTMREIKDAAAAQARARAMYLRELQALTDVGAGASPPGSEAARFAGSAPP